MGKKFERANIRLQKLHTRLRKKIQFEFREFIIDFSQITTRQSKRFLLKSNL